MWQQHRYIDENGSHPYFVYTPTTYQMTRSVPLVVMLHGCTQTAEDFATGTSMNLLAEHYGFVVLYPQQTSASNYKRCWNWFLSAHQQRGYGEPGRIVGMIKSLQQNNTSWKIDPTRIYIAGFSAGAGMAVILGATYPDIFAAIGVHSGLEYQAATNVRNAFQSMWRGGPDPLPQGHAAYIAMGDVSRVVPTIVFHGTGDMTVVSVNGDQVVQQWMQTNRLASRDASIASFRHPTYAIPGQVPNGYSYVVATWNASGRDKVQSYWKIGGMGHAWSGGNPAGSYTDPRGPGASEAMLNFFRAHPMNKGDRQSILSQRIRRHHALARLSHHRKRE